MPDRILMNPENRSLASSGSNDFSLYGAQPSPGFTLRTAESAARDQEAPLVASPPPHADAGTIEAPLPAEEPLVRPELAIAAAEAAPIALHDAAFAAPSHGGDASTTGSLIPLGFAAAALPANPPLPAAITSHGEAAAPLEPLPPASAGPPSEALSLSAPIIEAATPDAVTLPAAPLPATLADAAEASEILTEPATGAFAMLGPVDAAADAADDVQDLLGADPAAGIATLVSLVSVSDVLPVTEAANDAGAAAQDPGSDLLDALAADAPESNLLGIDTHDHDDPSAIVSSHDVGGAVDLPGGLG